MCPTTTTLSDMSNMASTNVPLRSQQPPPYSDDEENEEEEEVLLSPPARTTEDEDEDDDLVADLNASVSSLNLEDVFVPTTTDVAAPSSNYKKTNNKKRTRNVRFSEEEDKENSAANADGFDQWWTREELRDTQRSFVFAVTKRERDCIQRRRRVDPTEINESDSESESEDKENFESLLLDNSSPESRKRRKIVRKQMISTIKVVKHYENVTNTITPPEMLSELLERYSSPSTFEAFRRASSLESEDRTITAATVTTKKAAIPMPMPIILPTISESHQRTTATTSSDKKKATDLYSQQMHSSCSSLFASSRESSLQNSSSALAA